MCPLLSTLPRPPQVFTSWSVHSSLLLPVPLCGWPSQSEAHTSQAGRLERTAKEKMEDLPSELNVTSPLAAYDTAAFYIRFILNPALYI